MSDFSKQGANLADFIKSLIIKRLFVEAVKLYNYDNWHGGFLWLKNKKKPPVAESLQQMVN
jgi:hypothetical protein